MLKRLDRLIIKAFIGPFLATFVLSMFLFLMQFLWKYIDDLVGKGLDFTVLLRLITYSLADLVPMALPLTIMVASLMTYGNLSESFELVAIKGNGISLRRALAPIFGLMMLLALLNFFFMNVVIPRANLEAKALLYDIRQKKPAFNIDAGKFYHEIDGVAMRIGKKEKDNETIHDILIFEFRKDDSKRLNKIIAEKGTMKLSADKRYLNLTLINGARYEEMTQAENYARTQPFNTMKFEKQFLKIDLSSLDLKITDREAYKGDHRLMGITDLNKEIDSSNRKIIKYEKDANVFLNKHFHLNGELAGPKNSLSNSPERSKPITEKEILKNYDRGLYSSIFSTAISAVRNIKGTTDGLVSNLKLEDDQIVPYKAERHKKFSLSFIILLLFLISAPLGAIIRKGGIGMPLVISVILFVLFYAINLTGEKLGKAGSVPLWVGMWMSSLILLPVGLFITYKASKDSSVLSFEPIKKLFRRIFGEPIKHAISESAISRKWKIAKHRKNKP